MTSIQIGECVKFKDESQLLTWNIQVNAGRVIDVRQYGPKEAMVTAQFGDKRVHVGQSQLDLLGITLVRNFPTSYL